MEHAHHHPHHPHHADQPVSFDKAFALSVTLNFLFTVIEAFYAISAHSMSLLADAGHNFSDVLALLMAWGANWLMRRPATERYSYGYKRTTIFSAMVNALILVFTSSIILYESVRKLFHPTFINEHIIIGVAIIGIFINGGTALLFRKGHQHDLNIKGAYLHLLIDGAISLGVVMTGIVVLYTHWLWFDPLAGILIILIIFVGIWGLLRDSFGLFLDAVPSTINHQAVKHYLASLPGVTSVHDLHIWALSTQEVALTAHLVTPDRHFTDEDYQTVNHVLKTEFHVDHATLQVEISNTEAACGQVERC